jgi:competence protein ComEC
LRRVASTIVGAGQKPGSRPAGTDRPTAWHLLRAAIAAERPQAFLFAPVLLGAGIALWFLLPFNDQRQAALLLALGCAALGLLLPSGPRRLAVAAGLLVALGLIAADWRSASVASPRLHHRLTAAPLEGTVLRIRRQEGGSRHSLLIQRDASSVDPAVRLRIGMAGPLPPWLVPGARIRLVTTLGPIPGPALPGAHDPARTAWFDQISATGRAMSPPILLQPAPPTRLPLAQARQSLGQAIQARLGGDAGAIAVALTVGDQGAIRPDLLEDMRVAGLAHILTVSGFHIGVAVGGLLVLFRRLLALWPWLALRTSVTRIAAILAGLGGTAYAILSGAEPPAIRAAIAAWVVLAALILGRDPFAPRLIAFAALLILLARPESLVSPSFQLSFAAVTALAMLARSRLGEAVRRSEADGPLMAAARLVGALVAAGLVAELVLTPIALHHFGRAGAYGVIANILAVPLTSFLIMPLLGAWLLLEPLGLGILVSGLLGLALDALAAIGTSVAAWPGATLTLPAMPLSALLLLLSGALLLMLLVGRLRWAGLPLLLCGTALAILAPRPDILVAGDGRQVGVVFDGRLHLLRGTATASRCATGRNRLPPHPTPSPTPTTTRCASATRRSRRASRSWCATTARAGGWVRHRWRSSTRSPMRCRCCRWATPSATRMSPISATGSAVFSASAKATIRPIPPSPRLTGCRRRFATRTAGSPWGPPAATGRWARTSPPTCAPSPTSPRP